MVLVLQQARCNIQPQIIIKFITVQMLHIFIIDGAGNAGINELLIIIQYRGLI